jgi:hypothetical protein
MSSDMKASDETFTHPPLATQPHLSNNDNGRSTIEGRIETTTKFRPELLKKPLLQIEERDLERFQSLSFEIGQCV